MTAPPSTTEPIPIRAPVPTSVHGRVVTDADPVGEDGGLAGVDVQAAQVLDVALGADRDLIVVGPQDSAVPHA
jgi:hypothetical protein